MLIFKVNGSGKSARPAASKPQPRADRANFKFFSYDYAKLDRAVQDVTDVALSGGARVIGPVPLPSTTRRLCLQSSVHLYGASKEHYKRVLHKRLISIQNYSVVANALSTLGLPSGVYVHTFHKTNPKRMR